MNLFIIFTVMIVSWVCTYVNTDQTVHFNRCSRLYVNYTAVLKKEVKMIKQNLKIKDQLAEFLLPWPGLSLVNGHSPLPSGTPESELPSHILGSPLHPTSLLHSTAHTGVLCLAFWFCSPWLTWLPSCYISSDPNTVHLTLYLVSPWVWLGSSRSRVQSNSPRRAQLWMGFPMIWEMGTLFREAQSGKCLKTSFYYFKSGPMWLNPTGFGDV